MRAHGLGYIKVGEVSVVAIKISSASGEPDGAPTSGLDQSSAMASDAGPAIQLCNVVPPALEQVVNGPSD